MSLAQFFKRECIRIYGSCNTYYPCPDMFVGVIDTRKNVLRPLIVPFGCLNNCELSTIGIILESPHKKEFDGNGFPIGPARGSTGTGIKNYLIPILKKKSIEGKYKVLLIESVSYQCSNGEESIDHAKRNRLFKRIWENGGESDFIARLKLYKPYCLINACSGGKKQIVNKKRSSLNYLVHQSILQNFPNNTLRLFYSDHPSFWKGSSMLY
ncbi:MAG: hypothetical protein SPM09_12805 [Fibrobacter sp.]|uniref:hypothetical protein n=1 Tax=Fibrobacter sp. TaxID=35828 RepID=UPI002A90B18D|nr:hypothetical protein [Fibrobacter sp.]MDY6265281.1 hypothetical protein [Fibrobacter sp.]